VQTHSRNSKRSLLKRAQDIRGLQFCTWFLWHCSFGQKLGVVGPHFEATGQTTLAKTLSSVQTWSNSHFMLLRLIHPV